MNKYEWLHSHNITKFKLMAKKLRDALTSDLQVRISSLRAFLCKRLTLESSVAGSILIGFKKTFEGDQK